MKIIRGKQETAQKVVVYGPEGIGKSTLASRFPEPLFIDTEGSTKHMDVARTEPPASWTALLEQVKYVRDHPETCRTLVIDTADWAERLCRDQVTSSYKKTSIEEFGYGKGYVYLAEEFGRLLNHLNEIVECGIHVVLTAHAVMRKFEQPDEMGSYDRWELKLEKKTAPLVKEWADLLLFANYKTYVVNVDGQGVDKGKNKAQGGKRVMYTSHHPCWDAKNRHGLPAEIPMEFSAIAHLFPAIVAPAAKTDPVVPPPTVKPPAEYESLKRALDADTATFKQATLPGISIPDDPPAKSTVTPVQTPMPPSKQEPPAPAAQTEDSRPEYIPPALWQLMQDNLVTEEELRQAVAKRGYYPMSTPISRYESRFVQGVLIAAWPKVYSIIREIKGLDKQEIPFK